MTTPAPYPVIAVAAIVFDARGRVLVIERGQPPGVGRWTVPGGKLRHGEALVDAVKREVREETGLEVTPGPLVAVVERTVRADDGAYHFVILDYLATIAGAEPQAPRPGDDARDARWMTVDELAAVPTTDGLLTVIAQAQTLAPAR